ncbi:MAG TPA: class II fumarate hydratase [Bryobacteraceae bacterium]|jgi:fumarate hydratase class II|nr:class II fumarate hydratase [Bryobacteraceae bacterium]
MTAEHVTRIEHDSMGAMAVAADALYGAQTARAIENFPVSSLRPQRPFLRALGLIKAAAARVNGRHGWVEPGRAGAIERAAMEVAEGHHDGQFLVDVFQTGSGTSTNMNANEVIGHIAGAHPNDEVNRGQSSNDVFPSAIHIAAVETATHKLLPSLDLLERELSRKAREFHDVIKIGRTHLQDAVPMRLGQEFSGYAQQVKNAIGRVTQALEGLYELALGGTAVGTGLNAPEGFAAETIAEIAHMTGCPFVEAKNHFEAQAAKDAVVFLSGALRGCAVALTKIANDIRWLGSGPRCAFGEIKIPPVQPGSSIMPGKVNPVIAESLLMVCAQIIGYDATIAWCGAAGNFELNVMMPVMAWDLIESITLLATASRNFEHHLLAGLEADRERALSFVEQSLAMGTALAPEIGYDDAATLVKNAYLTERTVREVAIEQSGLTPERLKRLLDPATQAGS